MCLVVAVVVNRNNITLKKKLLSINHQQTKKKKMEANKKVKSLQQNGIFFKILQQFSNSSTFKNGTEAEGGIEGERR